MKTLFVSVWGFDGVAWIMDLGRFARRGDEGIVFCSCCMGRFELMEDFGVEGLFFAGVWVDTDRFVR